MSYWMPFTKTSYKLILGEIRHCGYYLIEAKWPFLITRALRAIEDHLFNSLNLSAKAIVLNAGYRVGYVTIYIAKKGLHVFRINVINHYLIKANRNIKVENFKQQGSVILYKYDFKFSKAPKYLKDSINKINTFTSIPANRKFKEGVLLQILEDIDLSDNIKPIFRLFFAITYLPFLIIRLFGLKKWFINTVLGIEGYRGRNYWRYIIITYTKPVISKVNILLIDLGLPKA
ncbi:sterol 24-C-methyltransferase [Cenococcum geophilum]